MACVNRLRLIPVTADRALDIIPVDHAAAAITRLLFADRADDVYHVSSGPDAATTTDALGAVLAAHFDTAPPLRFVAPDVLPRIRRWLRDGAAVARTDGAGAAAAGLGAYADYLDHWAATTPDRRELRLLYWALELYLRFMELGQVFDNARLLRDTGIAAPAPAHDYLGRCLPHLEHIDLLSGALDP